MEALDEELIDPLPSVLSVSGSDSRPSRDTEFLTHSMNDSLCQIQQGMQLKSPDGLKGRSVIELIYPERTPGHGRGCLGWNHACDKIAGDGSSRGVGAALQR